MPSAFKLSPAGGFMRSPLGARIISAIETTPEIVPSDLVYFRGFTGPTLGSSLIYDPADPLNPTESDDRGRFVFIYKGEVYVSKNFTSSTNFTAECITGNLPSGVNYNTTFLLKYGDDLYAIRVPSNFSAEFEFYILNQDEFVFEQISGPSFSTTHGLADVQCAHADDNGIYIGGFALNEAQGGTATYVAKYTAGSGWDLVENDSDDTNEEIADVFVFNDVAYYAGAITVSTVSYGNSFSWDGTTFTDITFAAPTPTPSQQLDYKIGEHESDIFCVDTTTHSNTVRKLDTGEWVEHTPVLIGVFEKYLPYVGEDFNSSAESRMLLDYAMLEDIVMKITSIDPLAGSYAGGTEVTITGFGFTENTDIYFGPDAASVTFDSETQLTVTTAQPSTPYGEGDTVAVLAVEGANEHLNDLFTYVNEAPVVTITNPADESSFDENENINFTATAIDPEDGDISASIDWSSSLDGTIGTGASINVDDLSVGEHTITAEAEDSDLLSGQDQITVSVGLPDPITVSSISPTSGTTAGGTACTITGTGFNSDCTVQFSRRGAGAETADNIVLVSDTEITCDSPSWPHSAGLVDIIVQDTVTAEFDTLEDGFEYT